MKAVNIIRGTHLLAIVILMVISTQPRGAECRTLSMMERELHPIDICIFTCNMCYKGQALVNCANECITSEATMGPFWTKTCRLFAGDFHGFQDTAARNTNFVQ